MTQLTPGELRAYKMGQLRGLEIAANTIQQYTVEWNVLGEALEHIAAIRDGISQAVNLLSLHDSPVQN